MLIVLFVRSCISNPFSRLFSDPFQNLLGFFSDPRSYCNVMLLFVLQWGQAVAAYREAMLAWQEHEGHMECDKIQVNCHWFPRLYPQAIKLSAHLDTTYKHSE